MYATIYTCTLKCNGIFQMDEVPLPTFIPFIFAPLCSSFTRGMALSTNRKQKQLADEEWMLQNTLGSKKQNPRHCIGNTYTLVPCRQ